MSLRLPLVFWYGAPAHTITCATLAADNETVFTGSSEGNIALWRIVRKSSSSAAASAAPLQGLTIATTGLMPAPEVRVVAILSFRLSPIIGICRGVYGSRDVIISASEDGFLAVWNMDGSRVYSSATLLPAFPTIVKAVPNHSSCIVVGFASGQISIIDIQRQLVLQTLSGHSDSITSMSLPATPRAGIIPNETERPSTFTMFTGSRDCTIRFWTVSQSSVVGCVVLNLPHDRVPRFLDSSFSYGELLLVGFYDRWLVYSFPELNLICRHLLPKDRAENPVFHLKGGLFYDPDHVMIFSRNQECVVYSIVGNASALFSTVSSSDGSSDAARRPDLSMVFSQLGRISLSKTLLDATRMLVFGSLGLENQSRTYPSSLQSSNLPSPRGGSGVHSPSMEGFGKHSGSRLDMASAEDAKTENATGTVKEMSSKRRASTRVRDSMTKKVSKQGFFEDVIVLDDLNETFQDDPNADVTAVRDGHVEIGRFSTSGPIRTAVCIPSTDSALIMLENGSIASVNVEDSNLQSSKKEYPLGACFQHSFFDSQRDRRLVTCSTTTSTLESAVPFLVHGFDNGDLCVEHIPSFAISSSTSPVSSGSLSVTWTGHRCAISCLRILNFRGKSLLLSGSLDGNVRVWSLADAALSASAAFSNVGSSSNGFLVSHWSHAGKVVMLGPAPNQAEYFYSLSTTDRSLVLYSLSSFEIVHKFYGHDSDLLAVFWRPAEDFVEMYGAEDVVHVWQISTGVLERMITGSSARELLRYALGTGMVYPLFLRDAPKVMALADNNPSSMSIGGAGILANQHTHLPLSRFLLDIDQVLTTIAQYTRLKANLPMSLRVALSLLLSDFMDVYENGDKEFAYMQHMGIVTTIRKPCYAYADAVVNYVPTAFERKRDGTVSDDLRVWQLSPRFAALHVFSVFAALKTMVNRRNFTVECLALIDSFLGNRLLLSDNFSKSSGDYFLIWATYLFSASSRYFSLASDLIKTVLSMLSESQLRLLHASLLPHLLIFEEFAETVSGKGSGVGAPNSVQNGGADNDLYSAAVFAIAMCVIHVPHAIEKRTIGLTSLGLSRILSARNEYYVAALSILGLGYKHWQYFLPQPLQIAGELFELCVPRLELAAGVGGASASVSTPSKPDGKDLDYLYDAVFPSLASIFASDPVLFTQWQQEIYANASLDKVLAAITATVAIITTFSGIWAKHLPVVTENVLKATMDPSRPQVRKSCLRSVSAAIRDICTTFPMAAFHQERQRLAVGDMNGVVRVWDLKTAQLYQQWKVHVKGPIAAVSFNASGDWLASYSLGEPLPRIWRADTVLLIGTSAPSSSQQSQIGFARLQAIGDVPDVAARCAPSIDSVRIAWRPQDKSVVLRVKEKDADPNVSTGSVVSEIVFRYPSNIA
eukprot:ANDGO_00012.mRNA.1 WD-40 repeat-containing protein